MPKCPKVGPTITPRRWKRPGAEKKDLLLDFTGSDWCGYCKLLDKEVFSTPQFVSWAKKNVVLVQVDFPHQTPLTDEVKKQNSGLAAKYPVNGYPTIVVIKPTGKEIAKETGYNPGTGAAAFIRGLETQMKKAGPLPGASTGESKTGGPGAIDLQDDTDPEHVEVGRRSCKARARGLTAGSGGASGWCGRRLHGNSLWGAMTSRASSRWPAVRRHA